jgi:hypothetical protein
MILHSVLNQDSAYNILDSSTAAGGTWMSRGCVILAEAFSLIYPEGKFVEVRGKTRNSVSSQAQHIAFYSDGRIIDGALFVTGIQNYLSKYCLYERIRNPSGDILNNISEIDVNLRDMRDIQASVKLAEYLRKNVSDIHALLGNLNP